MKLRRYGLILFAAALFFGWSTGISADTLSWTIAGADVSGSGSMTATNEGGGVYLVTGISGSVDVDSSAYTIAGLTSPVPVTPGTIESISFPGYTDTYDDLVYLGTASALDTDGLEFNVTGLIDAVNLCEGAAAYCNSAGSGAFFDDLGAGMGDAVTFSVATPEPSTLWMLSMGLLALMFFAFRRRVDSGERLQG